MNMFNYGDKVRYIGQPSDGPVRIYPPTGTIGLMEDCSGYESLIKWPEGTTSSDGRWWCENNLLELAEAAKLEPRKFNIGDKIRGISTRYSVTGRGWIGYVLSNKKYPTIHVGNKRDGSGYGYDVNEDYFELVAPAAPPVTDDDVVTCAECGCVIEDHDKIIMIDGKYYCEDCADDNFFVCDCCGEWHSKDEMNYVDGDYVCDYCLENEGRYFCCSDCGEWHDRELNDYVELYNGNVICSSCYDRRDYHSCEDCGRYFYVDDLDWDDEADGYLCPDCQASRRRRVIKNYSYKPDPIFKTGTHDKFYTDESIKELLFGVELEIDKGDDPVDCAQKIVDNTVDIYCKHDGSLMDGVEIVSHPCTLEYHLKSLGWGKICDIALEHKFLSQDANTCGLHIHVGRRQMGDSYREQDKTAGRCVLLVDRHWDSLVPFTRRTESKLDEWARRPDVRYRNVKLYGRDLETVALNTVDSGRYQAVNLENDNTVEFRLFRGTLKANTIYATLQLVSNIVTYAKTHTAEECMESKWTDITGVASYPELTEYLKNRELVEGKAPTDRDWRPEPKDVHVDDAVIREDEKFKVGDLVRVVNADGDDITDMRDMIDELATIVAVVEPGEVCDFEYGIDFGRTFEGSHSLRSGRNCYLDEPHGYWVYGNNLALVSAA